MPSTEEGKMQATAKGCLDRAKLLLAAGDEQSIRYACLELRLAIEYIVLDLFRRHLDESPEDVAWKWTPRQVIAELLEIDPLVDRSSTISIGEEATPGVPASQMRILGEVTCPRVFGPRIKLREWPPYWRQICA
ncbi:MAG: hypothetical protein K2Y40_17210, partial [Reyranella sp.]|nr:hypothetical protein [Reyranella sp.]